MAADATRRSEGISKSKSSKISKQAIGRLCQRYVRWKVTFCNQRTSTEMVVAFKPLHQTFSIATLNQDR